MNSIFSVCLCKVFFFKIFRYLFSQDPLKYTEKFWHFFSEFWNKGYFQGCGRGALPILFQKNYLIKIHWKILAIFFWFLEWRGGEGKPYLKCDHQYIDKILSPPPPVKFWGKGLMLECRPNLEPAWYPLPSKQTLEMLTKFREPP